MVNLVKKHVKTLNTPFEFPLKVFEVVADSRSTKWQVKIFPKGNEEKLRDNTVVHLTYLEGDLDEPANIDFAFAVKTSVG